jgi:hypothetical protein
MLSSDKNVETIGQMVMVLRKYLQLQGEYFKLGAIDKAVRLIAAAALAFVLFMLLSAIGILLSIAFAFWLAQWTGAALAFVIVAALYLFFIIVVVNYRQAIIVRPLVRFLTQTLMD